MKCLLHKKKTQNKCQLWKLSVWLSREKNDKLFVLWLVFDLRVGLKDFLTK